MNLNKCKNCHTLPIYEADYSRKGMIQTFIRCDTCDNAITMGVDAILEARQYYPPFERAWNKGNPIEPI